MVGGGLRIREGWARTEARERHHDEGYRNSPGGKAHITNQPAENPSAKGRYSRRFFVAFVVGSDQLPRGQRHLDGFIAAADGDAIVPGTFKHFTKRGDTKLRGVLVVDLHNLIVLKQPGFCSG